MIGFGFFRASKPTSTYVGYVDRADGSTVEGWCSKRSRNKRRTYVLVYLDEICIGRSLCNLERRDVLDAGYALKSGFFFKIPKSAYKEHSQKLSVKDKTGHLLPFFDEDLRVPGLPKLHQEFRDNLITPVAFSSPNIYVNGGFYDGYYNYNNAKPFERVEDIGMAFPQTLSQRISPNWPFGISCAERRGKRSP